MDAKQYIGLKAKEEADVFQKAVYGEYCDEYKRKHELLRKYQYEYRQQLGEIPIEAYAGDAYKQINAYMRRIEALSDTDASRVNMLIDRISETILLAPSLPENLVVYRAVSGKAMDAILANAAEHGDTYVEQAFLSTSLLWSAIVKEFPSYTEVMKIYTPKGSHALGVDGIAGRHEYELLFSAGQWLRYLGKQEEMQDGRTVYEFQLLPIF